MHVTTEKTGAIAQKEIEAKAEILSELAMKIWNKPETAYNEVNACKWTSEVLKAEGFDVEIGYAGLPTAIRASYGRGKPVIGFLGEYDALPGLSQKAKTVKEPVISGAPGQGCGHNLLGVGHVGAVIGMKKEMEEKELKGTIVFYGCPAEEVLTGKPFMARGGAFKELDAVIAWHPNQKNRLSVGTATALESARFHFKGVTAHAGGDPHNGRSALDAAELMNVGANFLREHVTSDVRIHYIITDGGTAPNVVPDRATNWYYVRALSREAAVSTYERLKKVAQGAAIMTETEMEVEYLGGCYNTLQNKTLAELLHDVMKNDVPLPLWSEDEIQFAKELNEAGRPFETTSVYEGEIDPDVQIHNEIPPISRENTYASTDVGDVQHIAPGVCFETATENIRAPGHSWHVAACSGTSIGCKGMLHGARVMAVTGVKLLENPEIITKARNELDEALKGRPYVCPMTPDIPIPRPMES
jgi:aminobenzoyl-glutamate utilization protein B